jgi:hypothetical protein
MEQLGFQWPDFHKRFYLNIFQKSVKEMQISLKCDKTDGCFTCRPTGALHAG